MMAEMAPDNPSYMSQQHAGVAKRWYDYRTSM